MEMDFQKKKMIEEQTILMKKTYSFLLGKVGKWFCRNNNFMQDIDSFWLYIGINNCTFNANHTILSLQQKVNLWKQ